MKENLALEVRKAYRLLFDYQERILNLMEFIGATYKLSYKKGKPLFSSRGSNNLNNWAWDWIYMYCYEFHFHKNDSNLWFSIILRNDTGFFENHLDDESLHRLEINKFKDVEESKTDLIFLAGKPNWNFDVLREATIHEKRYIKEQHTFFKTYCLEKFFTQNSTLDQLKDFENECSKCNISINIIDEI